MTDTFNGYHVWLGIPPHEQPPNHYRLLGIAVFEADLDVIDHAADRQMAHVRTFQSGRNAPLSQQILNELSGARLCLLSPDRKTLYDDQLRAKVAGAARGTPLPVARPLPMAQPVATAIPRAAQVISPVAITAPADPDDTDPELLADFRPGPGGGSVPTFPLHAKRHFSSPDESWQRPLVYTMVAAVVIVSLMSLSGIWKTVVAPQLKNYFDGGLASPDAASDPSVSQPGSASPAPPPPRPAAAPSAADSDAQ